MLREYCNIAMMLKGLVDLSLCLKACSQMVGFVIRRGYNSGSSTQETMSDSPRLRKGSN